MTKPVHIYVVLDRSGSMENIRDDMIGGFNSFLDEQKQQPDPALLTLIQFDSHDPFEVLTSAAKLADVAELTRQTFVPRGGTPLYDAMGEAISHATARQKVLTDAADVEEQVVFVTITDGGENRSQKFTRDQVFDLVSEREKKAGWVFVYMGANQDAYAEGGQMGYAAGATANYAATSAGTKGAYRKMSAGVTRLRTNTAGGQSVSSSDFFTDTDTPDAS